MNHETEGGVYVESCGHKYRVMTLRDFKRFKEFCTTEAAWKKQYEAKDGMIKVETRTPDPIPGEKGATALNVVRIRVVMRKVAPRVLYNALHDPVYRKTWDANMLQGYNIVKLNAHNDIGYYGAKFPWPLANRDFCNMRSWMEFSNGEFIIFNHSVPHPECPPKKDFVRARSHLSGYLIQPDPDGGEGCVMIYVSHMDPCGSIPHSVINWAMTSQGPKSMQSLAERAEKYIAWSEAEYTAGHIHEWSTPKMEWESRNDYPKAPMPEDFSKSIIAQAQLEASILNNNNNPRESEAGVGAQVFTYASEPMPDGTSSGSAQRFEESPSMGSGQLAPPLASARGSSDNVVMQQMATQIDALRRQLFLATQSSDSSLSLAPVAPGNPRDSPDVQRFRAIMNDAANYVDRQFIQEGHLPTTREYLIRLHCLLEGMRRTTILS